MIGSILKVNKECNEAGVSHNLSEEKKRTEVFGTDYCEHGVNQTDFWNRLKKEMEAFESNTHKDYRKNLFEFFIR